MGLSDYLIEAVARRTTGKYAPNPNKKSMQKWVTDNGFGYFEDYGDFRGMEESDKKLYTMGPNNYYHDSNWIRIHVSKDVPDTTFWFDSSDNLDRCGEHVNYHGRHGFKELQFDEAIKKIEVALR